MCCVLLDLENIWNPLRPGLLVFQGFFWLGDDGWWDGYAWMLEFAISEEGPDGFVEKSEVRDWGGGWLCLNPFLEFGRPRGQETVPGRRGEERVAKV